MPACILRCISGMTGLHASHMVIGVGILLFLIYKANKGAYTPEWHTPVEMFGLYWHFVDIVWIFLFPLLYLIDPNFGIVNHGTLKRKSSFTSFRSRVYIGVWLALSIGTMVTWQVALIDLGRLNVIVALTIAVCKATLVVLFFMHVKYSPKLTKLVVVAGCSGWGFC